MDSYFFSLRRTRWTLVPLSVTSDPLPGEVSDREINNNHGHPWKTPGASVLSVWPEDPQCPSGLGACQRHSLSPLCSSLLACTWMCSLCSKRDKNWPWARSRGPPWLHLGISSPSPRNGHFLKSFPEDSMIQSGLRIAILKAPLYVCFLLVNLVKGIFSVP